ncbi:hypothetical protein HanXRQr2_Chr10g0457931 [Helianthus annuus]|uniref:Uncharacterized protein n=1 Tax=Helianthus annuus TaxID=4232 RepID=A0A9K3I0X1_HELAN|nr:hypothetical protein HanXRQr2_Chr10g0457931 [Helianthus annuus]
MYAIVPTELLHGSIVCANILETPKSAIFTCNRYRRVSVELDLTTKFRP